MAAKRGAVELTTKWETDGPFFEKDVRKTVLQNIGDMLDMAAEGMEADVRGGISQHASSMPAYSGWSWAHTIGRRKSQTGREWSLWAVVSANTAGMGAADAIRTKAAAATIERRWHPYRTSTRAARKAIKALDLTKGLD